MTESGMIRLVGRVAMLIVVYSVFLLWSTPSLVRAEVFDGDVEAVEDPESPYAQAGVYLGIYGAIGIPTVLDDHIEVVGFVPQGSNNSDGPFSIDPSVGVGGRAGYRFGPRFALEGHFEWMSEFSIAFDDTTRPRPDFSDEIGTVETWAATVNLRYYLLTGHVQPYLLAGLGVMHFDSVNTSETFPLGQPNADNIRPILDLNISDEEGFGFASRLGGGLEIFLTESAAIVIGASYVLPTGDAENFDYVSTEVGLQMRF